MPNDFLFHFNEVREATFTGNRQGLTVGTNTDAQHIDLHLRFAQAQHGTRDHRSGFEQHPEARSRSRINGAAKIELRAFRRQDALLFRHVADGSSQLCLVHLLHGDYQFRLGSGADDAIDLQVAAVLLKHQHRFDQRGVFVHVCARLRERIRVGAVQRRNSTGFGKIREPVRFTRRGTSEHSQSLLDAVNVADRPPEPGLGHGDVVPSR